MTIPNPTKDLVLAYLQNKPSEQLEGYLKRGRQHVLTDSAALKERWLTLMREMFEFDDTNRVEREDIESEINLRGHQPPYDVLESETKTWFKKIDAAFARMRREEPERLAETEGGIIDDLAKFAAKLKNPSS